MLHPAATARLNLFQRLMRRWDGVHPYNAAQAVGVAGVADGLAIDHAWHAALAATGLGAVVVDGGRYHFAPADDHAVARPAVPLAEHLSADLERPFAAGLPFRPFVIPRDGGYQLGVVYQHWVADSVAVRLLMREWFARAACPARGDDRPLRLPIPLPSADPVDIVAGAIASVRRHCRMRRVQKVASHGLSDHATAVALYPAEPGLIGRVRAAAAARRVKVNDLFLAALAQAVAAHVPLQRRPRRRDVAVGSIVDLRPGSRADLSRTFGLYLGFTNVAVRPDELRHFDTLAAAVAAQTRQQKRAGVAPATLTWMSAALALGRFGKPADLYHFYRKELPLAAGLSNVDLTPTWVGRAAAAGRITDYVRVSPTGPMAPIAMTTTTVGDRFTVALTHRTGLVDRPRADAIAAAVLGRLRSL